ncbi:MAG: glycoside hydrolase family 2 protein, partial [Phycisphaerae bacterium]
GDDQHVSDMMTALVKPKDLRLPDPGLTWTARKRREGFAVRVHTHKPALWTWLDLHDINAKYSDNFVHLMPDSTTQWMVLPKKSLSVRELQQRLRVFTVRDVCPAMRG